MKLKLVLIAVVFCASSCSLAGNSFNLDSAVKIAVTEVGSDGADSFCSDFKLSSAQATAFFDKATKVTFRQLHDEFDWLSCYVRGELVDSSGKHRWEIRAGWTGNIDFENGDVIYFACPECEDGFK